jgi:hypothetical protein
MENKVIVFAVVALMIGAGIGFGIGYLVHNDDTEAQEWYFYVDYGAEVDSTHVNGWYTGHGDTALDALNDAFNSANIEHDFQAKSWGTSINTINGVSGSSSSPWLWWGLNILNATPSAGEDRNVWVESGFGIDGITCNYICLSYGDRTEPIAEPKEGWANSGPLKEFFAE